ncbi:pescadillo homolog [Artemia franciscana]
MGNKRLRKYSKGEAARFITRTRALRKLQLSLNDFRKLCILKGIYPREPRNRVRAQKGQHGAKTLYYVKDIRFLSHEPLMLKFREMKIFIRKLQHALNKNNKEAALRIEGNRPVFKLDHLVKERYPTFLDAIRDLDDCLSLCFLYASLPKGKGAPVQVTSMARRLTTEFMHYIIEAKALRKVFISIKGIYYQAEVKGQLVTWVVPHSLGYKAPDRGEVDLRVMKTFMDFYTYLLGFVNFRLYHSLNLIYPPKLGLSYETESSKSERTALDLENETIASLSQPLAKTPGAHSSEEEEIAMDDFKLNGDTAKLEEMKKEMELTKQLQHLFDGLKFYANREVPRESLVFIIRSCGGQVSWDKNIYEGATFDENDETVTHQIVDRPLGMIGKQFMSRYYIQPQWVFDCVNYRQLLPVEDYFPGATLPPHISPFVVERLGEYVPPEMETLKAAKAGETVRLTVPGAKKSEDESDVEDTEMEDEEVEEHESDVDISEEEASKVAKMKVKPGQVERVDKEKEKAQEDREHKRFGEMLMKRKHKRLYRNIMETKRKRANEARYLSRKREQAEEGKPKKKKRVQ